MTINSEATAVQPPRQQPPRKKEERKSIKKKSGKDRFVSLRSLRERIYYTVLYAVYMYGNKAGDRVFWGFKCREYEDEYVYVARAMGRYLCTRYYESSLIYWLSLVARCAVEYGSKGMGLYIRVKKLFSQIDKKLVGKVERFVKRHYPRFYEAISRWYGEGGGDEVMDTLYDLEFVDAVDGVIFCPARSVLHIRVEEGGCYVVYVGYR